MTVAACWIAIIAGVAELPFVVYVAIHHGNRAMWIFVPVVLLQIAVGIFGVSVFQR